MSQIVLTVGGNTAALSQSINAAVNRPWNIGQLNTRGFSQPLGKITGQASEFSKSLEAANARVIAFGASALAIALVKTALDGIIGSTVQVEASMVSINSVLGLTNSQLGKFSSDLFLAASQAGVSFKDAATAAMEFSRQGLSAEETIKRTSSALVLARLSGMSFTAAVTDITAAINSFNKEALISEDVVNRMAAVDARFAVSAADLAEGIKRVGASASDANVTFNQMLALITSVQQSTARGGAVIGNAFKTIFTRMGRPEVLQQLESLGIQTRTATGEIRPLVDILKNLAQRYDHLGPAQRSLTAELLGGVYQINILKAAMRDLGQGTSVFDGALKAAGQSSGEANRRIEELNNTVSGKLTQTLNSFIGMSSKFGSLTIAPVMKSGLDFGKWAAENLSQKVDGDGIGAKIGEGLLRGIGNILSGPGVQIATFAILKLFGRLVQFGTVATREFFQITTEASRLQAIEQSTAAFLSKQPDLLEEIRAGRLTIVDAARRYTHELASQNEATLVLKRNSLDLARILQTPPRGVGGQPIFPQVRATMATIAHGWVPNFNIMQREESEARSLGASSGVRAHTSRGTIGGKRFVMNNQETEIPNFGRNGDSAVIPHYAGGNLPDKKYRHHILDRDFLTQQGRRKDFNTIIDYITSKDLIGELVTGAAGVGKTTYIKNKYPNASFIGNTAEALRLNKDDDRVVVTRALANPFEQHNEKEFNKARAITLLVASSDIIKQFRTKRAEDENSPTAFGRKGYTHGPTSGTFLEAALHKYWNDKNQTTVKVIERSGNDFSMRDKTEEEKIRFQELQGVLAMNGAFTPYHIGHDELYQTILEHQARDAAENPNATLRKAVISVSRGEKRGSDVGLSVSEKTDLISRLHPEALVTSEIRDTKPGFKAFEAGGKAYEFGIRKDGPARSTAIFGPDRLSAKGENESETAYQARTSFARQRLLEGWDVQPARRGNSRIAQATDIRAALSRQDSEGMGLEEAKKSLPPSIWHDLTYGSNLASLRNRSEYLRKARAKDKEFKTPSSTEWEKLGQSEGIDFSLEFPKQTYNEAAKHSLVPKTAETAGQKLVESMSQEEIYAHVKIVYGESGLFSPNRGTMLKPMHVDNKALRRIESKMSDKGGVDFALLGKAGFTFDEDKRTTVEKKSALGKLTYPPKISHALLAYHSDRVGQDFYDFNDAGMRVQYAVGRYNKEKGIAAGHPDLMKLVEANLGISTDNFAKTLNANVSPEALHDAKTNTKGFKSQIHSGAGAIFDAAFVAAFGIKAKKNRDGADFDVPAINKKLLPKILSFFDLGGINPAEITTGDFKSEVHADGDARRSMAHKVLADSTGMPASKALSQRQKEWAEMQADARAAGQNRAAGYIPNFANVTTLYRGVGGSRIKKRQSELEKHGFSITAEEAKAIVFQKRRDDDGSTYINDEFLEAKHSAFNQGLSPKHLGEYLAKHQEDAMGSGLLSTSYERRQARLFTDGDENDRNFLGEHAIPTSRILNAARIEKLINRFGAQKTARVILNSSSEKNAGRGRAHKFVGFDVNDIVNKFNPNLPPLNQVEKEVALMSGGFIPNFNFIKGRNTFQAKWMGERMKKDGVKESDPGFNDYIMSLAAKFRKKYEHNQGMMGFAGGFVPNFARGDVVKQRIKGLEFEDLFHKIIKKPKVKPGAPLDFPHGFLSDVDIPTRRGARINDKTVYGDLKYGLNTASITHLMAKYLMYHRTPITKSEHFSNTGFSMLYKDGPADHDELKKERPLKTLVAGNPSLLKQVSNPKMIDKQNGQLNERGRETRLSMDFLADRVLDEGFVPNFAREDSVQMFDPIYKDSKGKISVADSAGYFNPRNGRVAVSDSRKSFGNSFAHEEFGHGMFSKLSKTKGFSSRLAPLLEQAKSDPSILAALNKISPNYSSQVRSPMDLVDEAFAQSIGSKFGQVHSNDSSAGVLNKFTAPLITPRMMEHVSGYMGDNSSALYKRLAAKKLPADKAIAGLYNGGYVPNFSDFSFEKGFSKDPERARRMKMSSGSFLKYRVDSNETTGERGISFDYISGKKKGEAFGLFNKLGKLARRMNLPIVSEELTPQKPKNAETFTRLMATAGGDTYNKLLKRYPQLRYRDQPGKFETKGQAHIEGMDADSSFNFKSLAALKKKVNSLDVSQIHDIGFNNVSTRALAHGHVPNFANVFNEESHLSSGGTLSRGNKATRDGLDGLLAHIGIPHNSEVWGKESLEAALSKKGEKLKLFKFLQNNPIEIGDFPENHKEIKDGNHRFALAKLAGIKNIPMMADGHVPNFAPDPELQKSFARRFQISKRGALRFGEKSFESDGEGYKLVESREQELARLGNNLSTKKQRDRYQHLKEVLGKKRASEIVNEKTGEVNEDIVDKTPRREFIGLSNLASTHTTVRGSIDAIRERTGANVVSKRQLLRLSRSFDHSINPSKGSVSPYLFRGVSLQEIQNLRRLGQTTSLGTANADGLLGTFITSSFGKAAGFGAAGLKNSGQGFVLALDKKRLMSRDTSDSKFGSEFDNTVKVPRIQKDDVLSIINLKTRQLHGLDEFSARNDAAEIEELIRLKNILALEDGDLLAVGRREKVPQRRKATGYIPNFNAIQDAVHREHAAGHVPNFSTRFAREYLAKVEKKNPNNPDFVKRLVEKKRKEIKEKGYENDYSFPRGYQGPFDDLTTNPRSRLYAPNVPRGNKFSFDDESGEMKIEYLNNPDSNPAGARKLLKYFMLRKKLYGDKLKGIDAGYVVGERVPAILQKSSNLLNLPIHGTVTDELLDKIGNADRQKYLSNIKPNSWGGSYTFNFTPQAKKSKDALARGYVPNFNAIQDAVRREHAAGLPMSSIRVDRHPSLVSSHNPSGLGVWNTVQETGLSDGMSKARSAGINPMTKGMSRMAKGHVPNFSEEAGGSSFGMSAFLGALAFMIPEFSKFGSAVKSATERLEATKKAREPFRQATAAASHRIDEGHAADRYGVRGLLGNSFNPRDTAANQTRNAQAARRALEARQATLIPLASGNSPFAGLHQAEFARNQTRIDNFATGQREAARDRLRLRRASRAERGSIADEQAAGEGVENATKKDDKNRKRMSVSLTASMGINAFAGLIPQETAAGKSMSMVAETFGTAAQVMSVIPGPLGIAAAAITSIPGFVKAIHQWSSKSPAMQVSLDHLKGQVNISSAALSEYSQSIGSLSQLYGDASVSTKTITDTQNRISKSLLGLSENQRNRVLAENTIEGKQRIVGVVQEEQKKSVGTSERALEFEKSWELSRSRLFSPGQLENKSIAQKEKELYSGEYSSLGSKETSALSEVRKANPLIKTTYGKTEYGYEDTVGTQSVTEGNSMEIMKTLLSQNIITQEIYDQHGKDLVLAEKYVETLFTKQKLEERSLKNAKEIESVRTEDIKKIRDAKNREQAAEGKRDTAIYEVDSSVKSYVGNLLQAATLADKLQSTKNSVNLQMGTDAVSLAGMRYGAGTQLRLGNEQKSQEVYTKLGEEKAAISTESANKTMSAIMDNVLSKSDSKYKTAGGETKINEDTLEAKGELGRVMEVVSNDINFRKGQGKPMNPKEILDNFKSVTQMMVPEGSLKYEILKGAGDTKLYQLIDELNTTMTRGIENAGAAAVSQLAIQNQAYKGQIAILDEQRKGKMFGAAPDSRKEERDAERQLKKDKRGYERGDRFATQRYAKGLTNMFGDSLPDEVVAPVQAQLAKGNAINRARQFGIVSAGNNVTAAGLRKTVGYLGASNLQDLDLARARTVFKGENKNVTAQGIAKGAGLGDMSPLVNSNAELKKSTESLEAAVTRLSTTPFVFDSSGVKAANDNLAEEIKKLGEVVGEIAKERAADLEKKNKADALQDKADELGVPVETLEGQEESDKKIQKGKMDALQASKWTPEKDSSNLGSIVEILGGIEEAIRSGGGLPSQVKKEAA